MTYIVDTDWVADYLKGRAAAISLLDQLLPNGVALSVITIGEIYGGVHYGHDAARHEAGFERFLRGVGVLGVDAEIARRFGVIRGGLRATGQPIGDPDILIAATAIHHDRILVTRNVRDSQRIPAPRIY